MEKMDFNELMFLKIIYDDWNNSNVNLWPICRNIRTSAFIDGGKLKALSVNMHVELERGARELGEVIDRFYNRYDVSNSKSNSEKFDEILKKIHDYEDYVNLQRVSESPELAKTFDKARRSSYEHTVDYRPIVSLINSVKSVIKAIDSSISFTNAVYKVDYVKDTRYDETSSQKVLKDLKSSQDMYDYDFSYKYDEIEKYAKDNNIDMGTPEYSKLIVKRLRAFKQDLISTVNKYYGKNSRFADLNIMDLVL